MYNPMAFKLQRLTASKLISYNPCFIKGMIGNPKGAAKGIISFYSGNSANGELMFEMTVSTSMSQVVTLVTPLYFNKGLYVNLSADVLCIAIMYSDLPFEKLLMSK